MENEQVEQETIKMEETRKQLSRLEVIRAVLTVGVLGFWFGFGATLGTKMAPAEGPGALREPMVNSLEELISI